MSSQGETIYGLGLKSWQILATLLNAGFIVVSALTVLFLVGLWRSSVYTERLKDREFVFYKGQVEQRIAAANTVALNAQKDLANARIQLAQVQSSIRWRNIDAVQSINIQESLIVDQEKVTVQYVIGDAESQSYAYSIANALAKSGWQVNMFGGFFSRPTFGLFTSPVQDNQHNMELLKQTLLGANLPLTSKDVPNPSSGIGLPASPGDAVLTVGVSPSLNPSQE